MIGSLGFLSPWLLVALAALPLIWLLLRLTPPRPRQVDFPPTRILLGLDDRDRTPARTPWWLTLLRLVLVALLIGALAEPVLRPDAKLTAGTEPLLVILDNGWDAAPDFADRAAAVQTALSEAARDGRPVSFVASAEPRAESLAAAEAAVAESRLGAIVPRPYLPDREALASASQRELSTLRSVEVLWLAGPLDGGDGRLLCRCRRNDRLAQHDHAVGAPAHGAAAAGERRRRRARAGRAARRGRQRSRWPASTRRAGASSRARQRSAATDAAPPRSRCRQRSAIRSCASRSPARKAPARCSSSTARWRRKSVGLIAGESAGGSQPLLEPLTYVERALAPTADLLRSEAASTSEAVTGLIRRGASIIVLTETGTLPPDTTEALVKWVQDGGTLLRFASPNLAATTIDALLPVRLRQGERALGGSLSWEEPQPVGDFPDVSPFAHIDVPEDVRVSRQVLADPDALRDAQVWAELRDGTPLVTARAEGKGRIVLFHVTADPRWSNLPLSGAFLEMLGAIVDTAGTVMQTAGHRGGGASRRHRALAPGRGAGRLWRSRPPRSRRHARRRHRRGAAERRDPARPL